MGTLEQRLSVVEDTIKVAGLTVKEVLTFDETVAFTGLSKSYLYKLTMNRIIPHFKPNGKLCYFNRIEVEEWLQQNRVVTAEETASQAQTHCMKRGGVQ